MGSYVMKFTGLNELQRGLIERSKLEKAKQTVLLNGDELNKRMKAQTKIAFVKGYSNGDTAGSINTTITDGGLTAIVGATTHYSGYVERGTRFMAAEPFAKPAFNVQKRIFNNDLKRLVR